MSRSTITSKNQTTIPKDVRERLKVGAGDVLRWELREDGVQVSVADTAFLRRRGSIHVGPGSVLDDLARARAARGRDSG